MALARPILWRGLYLDLNMAISIKALIFDYGNVLCGPQQLTDLQEMAAIFAMPVAEFEPIYWRNRMTYDASKIDAGYYWLQAALEACRTLSEQSIAELRRLDVESWSRPNPVMAAWARSLRNAGVRTAVLSNMPTDLRLAVTSPSSWLPEFDHMTFSCDIGVCKPERAIYEHCLQGLGVAASDALFLDDRAENIEASRQAGIHSLLFTTPAEATKAMDGHYLLPVALTGAQNR